MYEDNVLDVYGNNAAVRCPACGKVFVVSRLVNKVKGRACPNCEGAIAQFSGDSVSVAIVRE
jgi:NAD-dependent SIR2 family protein deacetylase